MRYFTLSTNVRPIFFLYKLAIIFLVINLEIFGPLRLTDIFLISSFSLFLISGGQLNISISIFFGLMLVLITASNLFSSLASSSVVRLEGAVFYYKYMLIFMIITLSHHLTKKLGDRDVIFRLLFFVFLLISSWCYAYNYLRIFGYLEGNWRPSYPLSGDYSISDSHVLSSYLGFFLLTYILFFAHRFGHTIIVRVLLSFFSLGAIISTAGRSGVVVIIVGLTIYLSICSVRMLHYKTVSFVSIVGLLLLVVGTFCFLFFMPDGDYMEGMTQALSRISNLDFGNDESSMNRISKLKMGISDAESSYFLFGSGFFASSLIWYDGLLAIILAHGGFSLLLLCIFGFSIFTKKVMNLETSHNQKVIFMSLLLSYVISNLITEYVLITRNSFPIVALLAALYVELNISTRSIRRRGREPGNT